MDSPYENVSEAYEDPPILMIRPGSDPGRPAPQRRPPPRSGSDPRRLPRIVASASVLPLLVLAWGWSQSAEARRQAKTLEALDRRLSTSRRIGQQIRDLRRREQTLETTVEGLRRMDRNRQVVPELLQALQGSVSSTPGVGLRRVHLDLAGLQIQGRSRVAAGVATLVQSLERSTLLRQVRLRRRVRDPATGTWNFQIESRVTRP